MPDTRLKIQVAHDRKTVAIEMPSDVEPSRRVEMTLAKLDELIGELGDENVKISAAANTTWCIKASPPAGVLLAFDHPKFGPVGFTLRKEQIATIVRFLTNRFILQRPSSDEKH